MKKSNLYLLVLIAIVVGISAMNMQLVDAENGLVTSKFTDHFSKPQKGDLYVFQESDSLVSYFKIQNEFPADSFGIVYGKEKATAAAAADFHWGREMIQNNAAFDEKLTVKKLEDLKSDFLRNDFAAIYRHARQSINAPWYLQVISSFFGFPIAVFFTFLGFWVLEGFGKLLHRFSKKIPEKFGYWLLALIGIFVFTKSVHQTFVFPDFGVAFLYGLISVGVPLLIFQFLTAKYFSKKSFADREALKFSTLLFSGIFFHFLAFQIGFLYYKFMGNTEQLELLIVLNVEFILTMSSLIWTAIATGNFLNNLRQNFNQLKTKEKQLAKAQKSELSSKAELDALQARINPHFLYNSLNSIASLAQIDPKKTEEMAIALSQFYKYSTNRADEYLTSVAEEVEILKTYLEIEKIRFGERLQFEIDTNGLKNEWQIPRFLLQPLAENAVKHGYDKTTNQIFIKVKISDSAKQLTIEILDSGAPFFENMKIGYGLSSIQKKLQLLFLEKHNLAFVNQPKKGVIIEIER